MLDKRTDGGASKLVEGAHLERKIERERAVSDRRRSDFKYVVLICCSR